MTVIARRGERHLLRLACAAALVAGLAVSATSPAGARPNCPGEFMTANRYWKVTYGSAGVLYACDQRRPARRPIVLTSRDVVYPTAALRGRLVALADEFYDFSNGPEVRIVRPDNPRETYEQLRVSASGNVADIALQDRRRVAWIACRSKLPSERVDDEPLCPGAVVKRVFVQDQSAPRPKREGQVVQATGRLLAADRNIKSKSLTLRGGVISWRAGDRNFRYRLR
jgi:hypothetical protein